MKATIKLMWSKPPQIPPTFLIIYFSSICFFLMTKPYLFGICGLSNSIKYPILSSVVAIYRHLDVALSYMLCFPTSKCVRPTSEWAFWCWSAKSYYSNLTWKNWMKFEQSFWSDTSLNSIKSLYWKEWGEKQCFSSVATALPIIERTTDMPQVISSC